ncbi:SDR family oxidoreductase [Tunturiibacter gelidoferens]|uniref:Nucleoside-diphosphate-sugar epimerase n=1 Tax=Tunturiibacter lichenicola TaxID=2051959 RepID=A0A7Y9T5I7_9BACT|nr:SDR family oxidoreductase [Edaphobacter lichenicola]NYF52364.1 nucleoside-diphosphate-sugar epimerase [Edaphobacter lichenicola]
MRVFVTGATGFIGSAVVKELIDAGHQVTGLARSEASAQKLVAAGARVHRGSIEDVECLRRGAAAADGAIHTAFYHEITHMGVGTRLRVFLGGSPSGIVSRFLSAAVGTDRRALKTMGRALAGPDRPLVAAFGTMAMTPGRLALEDDAYDTNSVGAARGASEDAMRELASLGIRTSVIRLPPIVHGEGDGGFAPRLFQIAKKKRESAYVGDGRNRWAAVHRLDAARLFRLALEKGPAGATYHGVAEEGVPFRDIAGVIGRHLNVPVVSKTPAQAAKQFSFLGLFVPVDNPTSSKLTQERLGWRPTQTGLLSDLDGADYFKA